MTIHLKFNHSTCYYHVPIKLIIFLVSCSLKPAGRQATTSDKARPVGGNTNQAKQQSQQSLNQQIATVKQQHAEELATLRKTFDEELAKEKDSLKAEQDIKITTYKNELSTQLVIAIIID